MKRVNDAELLERLLAESGILSRFSARPEGLCLLSYGPGELITSPDEPLTSLLFIARGSLRVYGIREDGNSFAVSLAGKNEMLGDMEFCRPDFRPFYTEAVGNVLCVALPMEKNREKLENDCVFLNYVLRCVADKVMTFARIGSPAQSVEEKLMTYLREIEPDGTLKSVNAGVYQLQCSRRQLQRAVKRLCGEGILEKTGRGRYALSGLSKKDI